MIRTGQTATTPHRQPATPAACHTGRPDGPIRHSPTAPPPSGWSLPRAAALALLAALLAAAPVAAQTDVWTATLTPGDFGSGLIGCNNASAIATRKCSTATVLSDDDFTYDSADYSVTTLFVSATAFTFTLDTDITAATNALTVVVGGTSLALADATNQPARKREWFNPGFSWTAGTAVSIRFTGPTPMVPPDWSLKPTGLAEGSQFRLLFLSSTKRDATATDIADYNTFVQDRAEAGHTDIQGYSAGFRAVGCTADTDARDNTATTGTGVPIYWLNGAKAADDYADFYDGDWDDEVNDKNESGSDGPDTSQDVNYPATGCGHDGTEFFSSGDSRALGESFVRVGGPNSSNPDHSPLNGDRSAAAATPRPMYGLSAVFEVLVIPPSLTSAVVLADGNTIQLAFSEDLQSANLPPAAAFTVTNAGTAVTVTGVAAGSTEDVLEITVSPLIGQGQVVVVTYEDPTNGDDANAIQDTVGNDTPDFTTGSGDVPAVTNNSTVANEVLASWSLTPTGLAAGTKFRLLFLSSTKRDANATDIADYNTFVQARAAAGHTDIRAYSAGFGAIGCTAAVDARDNTSTTGTGVSIYWLDGAKVADDYADFYDGSWDDEVNDKNESGTDAHDTSQAANYPFTGCANDGTEEFAGATNPRGLGANSGFVRIGRLNSSGTLQDPIDGNDTARTTDTRPMYGLSAVFEVSSSPSTNVPAAVSDVVVVPVRRTSDSLTVSWSAPDNAGKPALTGYDVRYRDDINWTTVRQGDAANTSLIITGLRQNAYYDVQVLALNADGSGPWSSTAEGATSPRSETLFANNPLIPDDLEIGDSFRLLHITEDTTDATDTGIHDYHNFPIAGLHAISDPGRFMSAWGGVTLGQSALVSTPGADARQITDTTWTGTDRGVPIYWLNGARVADDYADFYDGEWADEANPTNDVGEPHSLADPVPWTGTDHDGTELFDGAASRAVGQSTVGVGAPGSTASGAGPLNGDAAFASTEKRPLYALWHVMVVGENLRLVTNINQKGTASSDARAAVRAQLFTTGPHSSGYGIALIEVDRGSETDDFLGTVAIHTTDGDGDPDLADGLHATLSLERTHAYTWELTAPAGTVLKPSTTYALVFQGDSGTYPELWTLGADGEDTPADGWSLADALVYYSGSAWEENSNGNSLIIEMIGPLADATNTPATGAPTITGTAQVGQTLTAVTTAIMDTDGLTTPGYTYQWIRVATDTTETNIGSATASTYTLVLDDLGTTIKVKVSFTDDASNAETRTSVATAVVAAAPDTTPPTVTGTPSTAASGTQIQIPFNEALQQSNGPLASAFTVTADGSAVRVSAVNLDPSFVAFVGLTVSPLIRQGQAVVVTYTDPTGGNDTNAIQDVAGNDAATFTTGMNSVPAVDNDSTVAPVAPGAPTGLTATASGTTQIDLSWTAPADNGGRVITGYKIEISPNGTDTWTTHLADTTDANTTYAHTGLAASTTRHYRVSAINTIGTGAASNVDDATTGAGTNTAPTASNGEVTATEDMDYPFTAANFNFSDTDAGAALSSVKITSLPASGTGTLAVDGTVIASGALPKAVTKVDIDASKLTYSPPADASGDDYATFQFKVNDGTDDSANASTMTINVTAVNDAATGKPRITGTAQVGQLLTATVGTIADPDVLPDPFLTDTNTSFQWFRVTSGTDDDISGETASTYTLATADEGKTIKVKVSFQDGGGGSEGPLTSVATAVVSAPTAPGAPTGLTATANGTTQIDLSWTAPASDGGSVITGYKIEESPNGIDTWTDRVANTADAATTYAHTGLAASTTRHYRVSAINTIGTSAASNIDDATTGAQSEITLVGNAGQPTGERQTASFQGAVDHAQQFTTGANALGYTLTKVEFLSKDAQSHTFSAQLCEANNTGEGAVPDPMNCQSLSTTSSFAENSVVVFTPPAGMTITLAASTRYVVVLSENNSSSAQVAIFATQADNQSGETGWTLANVFDWKQNGTTWMKQGIGRDALIMDVKGYATTGTGTNTAPTASNGEVTATEDMDYPFTAANFNFSDTDPGAALSSVKITSLPASGTGTLAVDGTVIASGALPKAVTKVDIDASKLTYSPPADASGDDYATFQFKVNDGTDDSTIASTMTIDVTAVNDAATGQPGITGTAQVGQLLTATVGTIADPDVLPDPFLTDANTSFQWVRVTSGTDDDISGETASTYTLATADEGKTIKVKVSFQDGGGGSEGPLTSVATAVVSAPTAPGAPTGLTATASGNTQIDLSWTAPASDGGSAITGYKIEESPNGIDTWTDRVANTADAATTYAHTGLAASTTRHYRVSAINTIGTSAASNIDDATTGAGTLSEITLVGNAGQPTHERHTASFQGAVDHAQQFTTGPNAAGDTLTKVEFLSNDAQGHTFSAQLCEANNAGETAVPDPMNCQTLSTTSSFAQGSVVVFTPPSGMTITLAASTRYVVVLSENNDPSAVVDILSTQANNQNGEAGWTLADVFDWKQNGTTWMKQGSGQDALIMDVKGHATFGPPGAVSDVVVVPTPRSASSLTVSWTAPENTAKPAPIAYDVRHRETDTFNWTTVRQDDAASTSLIITGLRPNGYYDVQVLALNGDGSGPWSSTALAATSPLPETVLANHPLIPDDLGVGDSFRLLYITGATNDPLTSFTAATGTSIQDYNDFAIGPTLHIVEPGSFLSSWGEAALWQLPLVSMPGHDARLLTDTTWTPTDRGVPIYWLNGARVADDYADFYDGAWADEVNPRDGLGQPYPLDGPVPWTGTDHDGTELFDGAASRAMGQATVGVGGLGSSAVGAGPLNGRVAFASTEERPLYGLWHVMVVGENLRLLDNFHVPRVPEDEGADTRAAVRAQLFTTGPHSSGYGIVEIKVNGTDDDDFLGPVALYTTDVDGDPDLVDGLHATLILENNFGSPWKLTAPEGTVLKPRTTYALVFQGDAGAYPELWLIAPDGESHPAEGWSLADALLYHDGSSWEENPDGRSLQMQMIGPRMETEAPALVSATVGAAGNAVALVFDENVDLPSDNADARTFLASLASAFAVTADGAGVAVSGLTASSADQLTLVLSGVIFQGQAVTLTYTDPTAGDDAVALQDILGNETPTFTTGRDGVPAVINNSAITGGGGGGGGGGFGGGGRVPDDTTGDRIYYFPHLAVGAHWQTTITYINYSSEEVSCQTDFLSDQGSPLMVSFAGLGTVVSRTDVLPPGGSVHQETNVELSAPLAPGWARATCSGPVKASLLYRRYNSEGMPLAEAGVNATTVPATRFVTFVEQGEGQFGTGVAYANPSATAAVITFTARDADGEVLASDDLMLSPNGHGAQNMVHLFDLPSFTGSLEITSTVPIVSLSLNFEADPVFSSLPPGELDAAAQGSTTYYLSHLAVGANWQTTITYINYSSQEVTCETEFISDFGNPLMVSFEGLGTGVSRTDVLPPGGCVHQETNVELSAPLAPGWARTTCSGPVKASLLYRRRNSEGVPTGEAGVNATTVPATRFVTFAERGEGRFGTGVAYANPSDTAAVITFTAKDADGETLASVVRTLSPNGHDGQNMVHLFDLPSFTGSLEITSTEPIVSLSLNFEADPVFSSLPPGELDDAAQ